jgi:phospholipid/cholesterol/gamma-HCH transport system substrate-binding protein
MSTGRLEFKVGLFVVVLLGLAAAMSIKFNERGFGLRETYSLTLRTSDAGTIIRNSAVIMSGVKIGYVDGFNLSGNGSEVLINVQLYPEYQKVVTEGAVFRVRSSGFLGDQYIGVTPGANPGKPLKPNQKYDCEPPFDIEQIGGKVNGLLVKVDGAVESIDSFVKKMDQGLLSGESLTNLTVTIAQFRETSEKANRVATRVDSLLGANGPAITRGITNFSSSMNSFSTFTEELRSALSTNTPAVHESVTNFAAFTKRLHASAGELELLIATNAPTVQKALANIQEFSVKLDKTTADLQSTLTNNRTNITQVVENLATATQSIKSITKSADKILQQVESGNGLAGGLIKNEQMRLQFMSAMTNLNSTAVHFSNLASNLNARGIFYKPKPEPLVVPPRSVRPK